MFMNSVVARNLKVYRRYEYRNEVSNSVLGGLAHDIIHEAKQLYLALWLGTPGTSAESKAGVASSFPSGKLKCLKGKIMHNADMAERSAKRRSSADYSERFSNLVDSVENILEGAAEAQKNTGACSGRL